MLESTERTIKNEQSRDTVNIGHKKNPHTIQHDATTIMMSKFEENSKHQIRHHHYSAKYE